MRRVFAIAATAALVAAACGGEVDTVDATTTTAAAATTIPATTTTVAATTSTFSTTTTTTEAFSGPGYGGEAIIGDDQEPPTLNPYAPGGDNFIVGKIAQTWTTGVADIDATTLELIPEVVNELPTVDNGGVTVNDDGTMTVRYRIRDEAMWEDGTPITGDDFAFTWETVAALETDRFNTAPWGLVESVEAGDKTFTFTMSQPTLQHEWLFQWLIPKHDVEGSDFLNDWNDVTWLSAGPFTFDRWVKGESVTLIRNDTYWKTDAETGLRLPYLDEVTFRFIPETSALIDAFKAREVDVINPPPWEGYYESILDLAGVELDVRSSPIWEHINFQLGVNNRNPRSLNRYVEFRRAVAYALDIPALVKDIWRHLISGFVEVARPDLGPGPWARYGHDPEEATRLLDELCDRLGRDCAAEPPVVIFSTTSNADERPRLANRLQQQLADVGITVELQLEDSSLFFGNTLDSGDWDVGEWAWIMSPGTAALASIFDVFDPARPPPDGSNFYRWGTPALSEAEPDLFNQGPSLVRDEHTAAFAALLEEMRRTVDGGEIVRLAREAEAILADQVVIIPVVTRSDPGAVWADELAGYVHNPSQAGDTWNVEYWYRVDR